MTGTSVCSSAKACRHRHAINGFNGVSLTCHGVLCLGTAIHGSVISSVPHGGHSFACPSISLNFVFARLRTLGGSILACNGVHTSCTRMNRTNACCPSCCEAPICNNKFSSNAPVRCPVKSVDSCVPCCGVCSPGLGPRGAGSCRVNTSFDF